jgi:FkbM family methyltransferase
MELNQRQDAHTWQARIPEDERLLMKALFPAGTLTVHVGQANAPWTRLARAEVPGTQILEIEPETSIDSWRKTKRVSHLSHIVVQDFAMLPKVVEGARQTLAHARTDMLHFHVPPGHEFSPLAARLRRDGYIPFLAERGNPRMLDGKTGFPPGYYIMTQEHMLSLTLGKAGHGLDLPALCKNEGITVRGVVHVGAHEGQEIAIYDSMGARAVVFIEANPVVHARLAAAMKPRPNVLTVQRAVSDRAGKATLHVTSFDQSSSLLPLAGHRNVYPQIVESGRIEVDATPLDALMAEFGLDPARFNFLAVDVQGAELLVLKGATQMLRHIHAINIEVNFTELYAGCAQIEDIDDFLWAAGFHRAAMASPFHLSWGDAFYVRERPAAP